MQGLQLECKAHRVLGAPAGGGNQHVGQAEALKARQDSSTQLQQPLLHRRPQHLRLNARAHDLYDRIQAGPASQGLRGEGTLERQPLPYRRTLPFLVYSRKHYLSCRSRTCVIVLKLCPLHYYD